MQNGKPNIPGPVERIHEMICGCIEDTCWEAIHDELARLEREEYDASAAWPAAICAHFDLSEHGCSARGGWLTKKGKEALAFLREHGIDWYDHGWWIASDGCEFGDPDFRAKGGS